MAETKHTKQNGTYTFRHNGDKLYTTDTVCILYGINDDGTCILIKHCTPINIHTIAGIRKSNYILDGRVKQAEALRIVTLPNDVSLEELYKILNVGGYLKGYVEQNSNRVSRVCVH